MPMFSKQELAVPNLDKATKFLCHRNVGYFHDVKYSMLCYTSDNYPSQVKVIGQVVHKSEQWTYEILLNQSNFTNELLYLTELLVKLPVKVK